MSHQDNERILHILSLLLNRYERLITKDQVDLVRKSGVSEERAFLLLLKEYCGLDSALFDAYFPNMVKRERAEEYRADPYYRTVRFPEASQGKWRFGKEEYAPYEVFVRDDFLREDDRVFAQIGYFSEPFAYPAVWQGERLWMSVTPNEINTAKPSLQRAHGRVLTSGLGLGYYAFMASRKQEVESVTVVEREKDVISLFERFLLPQFPCKEKIKLVRADCFDYLDCPDEPFDFVFGDLWHDVGDGLDLYLRMKEYEKKYPRAEFTYWIERTMQEYL